MINSLDYERGRRESADRIPGNVTEALDWPLQRRTARGVNDSTPKPCGYAVTPKRLLKLVTQRVSGFFGEVRDMGVVKGVLFLVLVILFVILYSRLFLFYVDWLSANHAECIESCASVAATGVGCAC